MKIKIRQYEITIFILSLTHDIGHQKWRWISIVTYIIRTFQGLITCDFSNEKSLNHQNMSKVPQSCNFL